MDKYLFLMHTQTFHLKSHLINDVIKAHSPQKTRRKLDLSFLTFDPSGLSMFLLRIVNTSKRIPFLFW